jgi:1-phosphatidylinositol-3-phosphate 5-kinase
MNLVVMENLLYDRKFSKVSQVAFGLHIGNIWLKRDRGCSLGKIYDLKGSTRGRHVQSTGRENEVLLDENLNESESLAAECLRRVTEIIHAAAHLSPFFLREHSKRILRGALNSDTKFLADINVMDYSFVVGVDSGRNELVVGIVGELLHGRSVNWTDSH